MPTLKGKRGQWEVPFVHHWSERGKEVRAERTPVLAKDGRLAIAGACLSVGLAAAARRLGVHVGTHPSGHLYNSASIRQEIERVFGGWPERDAEPIWEVSGGFMDPFAKSYMEVVASRDEVSRRREKRDRQAREIFGNADVIAVFLEDIEVWDNPTTGNVYIHIPHHDPFPTLGARYRRLTVAEIRSDLERIHTAIRSHTNARLVVASSASWMHATFTPPDVRSSSMDAIARIHAAVSEMVEAHSDVIYFPLSEMVHTAEHPSDYFGNDGRHLHAQANDYVLRQLLAQVGVDGIPLPTVDLSWLRGPGDEASAPTQKAIPAYLLEPPTTAALVKQLVRRALPASVVESYRRHLRRRLVWKS